MYPGGPGKESDQSTPIRAFVQVFEQTSLYRVGQRLETRTAFDYYRPL